MVNLLQHFLRPRSDFGVGVDVSLTVLSLTVPGGFFSLFIVFYFLQPKACMPSHSSLPLPYHQNRMSPSQDPY